MKRNTAINSFVFFVLFSQLMPELQVSASDVETAGDFKVSGIIDNSGGNGIKFPDGNIQTSACSACANGVLPIALGGTGITTAPPEAGWFLRSTGAGVWGVNRIQASDIPSLSGTYVDLNNAQEISGDKFFLGMVGIGNTAPAYPLSVAGVIQSSSGGIMFPDGTVQTTAASPPWSQILPAAARFVVVMGSGAAVLDKETGLVWERSTDSAQRYWSSAYYYCYNLSLGGRKGWRLPSVEELSSLVDPAQSNPALPVGYPFTNVQLNWYWSSTTTDFDPNSAWTVNFGNGQAFFNGKGNASYVRCVRGG